MLSINLNAGRRGEIITFLLPNILNQWDEKLSKLSTFIAIENCFESFFFLADFFSGSNLNSFPFPLSPRTVLAHYIALIRVDQILVYIFFFCIQIRI